MRKLLIVLILISPIWLIGQEVNWGVPNESKNIKYEPGICAWNETGVYCFGSEGSNNFFEKLDTKTFKSIYIKEFKNPEYDGYKTTVEDVAFANDNFIVFCSYLNKKEKKMVIYAIEVSGETGVKTGKEKKIFDAEVEKNKRKGHFMVIVSDDNSKILINHYAEHKKENKMHDIYLLIDNELNVITEKTEKFDLNDLDYKTSNYMIDNQGSIYFWKNSMEGSSVVSFDANKNYDKWEESISIDSKPMSYSIGGSFVFDEEQNLLISGVYATKHPKGTPSKEKRVTKYEGVYYIKIDQASKEVILNVSNEYSKKEKEDIRMLRKSFAIDRYKYSDFRLIPTDDGGAILIGEKTFVRVAESKNSTTVMTYFMDLLVNKIDKDGNVTWAKRLPKNQFHAYSLNYITLFYSMKRLTRGMECFSYLPQVKEGKLNIYFNDSPKNLNSTKTTDKYKYIKKDAAKAVAVKCEFDLSDGKFKKELFKSISAKGLYFKPFFHHINNRTNECLIFGQKGKRYMFGVLK